MSSFTDDLDVRIKSSGKGRGRCGILLREFDYHVGAEESDDVIHVPAKFETDFASSPFFVWPFIPPWGCYSKAAVIHDFLYRERKRTRKEADEIFLEAMAVLKVPAWQRYLMFWGVRGFAWLAWRKKGVSRHVQFT